MGWFDFWVAEEGAGAMSYLPKSLLDCEQYDIETTVGIVVAAISPLDEKDSLPPAAKGQSRG